MENSPKSRDSVKYVEQGLFYSWWVGGWVGWLGSATATSGAYALRERKFPEIENVKYVEQGFYSIQKEVP